MVTVAKLDLANTIDNTYSFIVYSGDDQETYRATLSTVYDGLGIRENATSFVDAVGNVDIGINSLTNTTTGTKNIAIGVNAAENLTTGSHAIAIGFNALRNATSFSPQYIDPPLLSNNIAIGPNALASTSASWGNIAIGRDTLKALGDNPSTPQTPNYLVANYNIAIGERAGQAITVGSENILLGNNTSMMMTTGTVNTAIGSETLKQCTTGTANSAYGVSAIQGLTTGSHNTAVGEAAGGIQADPTCLTTGSYNTYLGASAANPKVITTATATAIPGQSYINVADATGITPGMFIADYTAHLGNDPLGLYTVVAAVASNTIYPSQGLQYNVTSGDTLYAWGNPTLVATSATTASGTVLTFTSVPTTVKVGMIVTDLAASACIPVGTTVVSKTSTTVTLSQSVNAGIGGVISGHTIAFTQNQPSFMTVIGAGAQGYRSSTVFLGRQADSVIIGGPNVSTEAALSIGAPASGSRAAINIASSTNSSPVNGDLWATSTALNARINDATYVLNCSNYYTAPQTNGYTPLGGSIWIGQNNGNLTLAPNSSTSQSSYNSAIGYSNGISLTTGYNNTFVGQANGNTVSTGYGNTLLGYSNCTALSSGYANTAVGALHGTALNTGNSNTLMGYYCGASLQGGSSNTLIGSSIGNAMVSTTGNIAIGSSTATGVTGSGNTIIGYATGGGITSGANNTIIGGLLSGLTNYSGAIIIADGNGNRRFNADSTGNIGLNGFDQYGSGAGVVFIKSAVTPPSTNPTGGGILYVEAGVLKYRGSSGTVTTLGNA